MAAKKLFVAEVYLDGSGWGEVKIGGRSRWDSQRQAEQAAKFARVAFGSTATDMRISIVKE